MKYLAMTLSLCIFLGILSTASVSFGQETEAEALLRYEATKKEPFFGLAAAFLIPTFGHAYAEDWWPRGAKFLVVFALDFLYSAKIERIIDGDTVVADLFLGLGVILDDQCIRLYGIDAWEIRGKEKPKGLLAKEYIKSRLKEGEIEIEIRPEWGRKGKGKYGRWLGVVYVDGESINAELLEKGHARKSDES